VSQPARPAERVHQLARALQDELSTLRRSDLPVFFAAVEELRRRAELQLSLAGETPVVRIPRLLDAKATAAMLGVDVVTIYRMARTSLRSAAVQLAEGTLRFDEDRLRSFIESRRR
jgi:hypothetical protein